MKEIPVLFNAEMVRAILEGHKTQTRRPFKYQPTDCWRPDRFCVLHELKDGHFPLRNGEPIPIGYGVVNEDGDAGYVSPFGNVGDVLTISEAVTVSVVNDEVYSLLFAADGKYEERLGTPELIAKIRAYKRPQLRGVFLPPAFQRDVKLPVTDIRVQRVQEISEEDAMAEGGWNYRNCPVHKNPVRSFGDLWRSIYNTWDANPWVWAATFEVVK